MGAIDRAGATVDRRPVATLVAAVVLCEVVGASGSVFTAMGLESWYPGLTKPALAPPDWVFAPVWTALFASMGVAAWLVLRRHSDDPTDVRVALGAFVAQFAVNVAWSAVFFGARSILGGLVVVCLLWLLILGTIDSFARVDRRAGALLVPYLAWVTFAAYLNYAFWTLN